MTRLIDRPLLAAVTLGATLPLLLLLSAGLLFGMKAVSADHRIWIAQPALGLPAVGPVNSAPFAVQLHRAVAQDQRFNRWAEQYQMREVRRVRRALALECPQIMAGILVAPTRADERAARRECRQFGY